MNGFEKYDVSTWCSNGIVERFSPNRRGSRQSTRGSGQLLKRWAFVATQAVVVAATFSLGVRATDVQVFMPNPTNSSRGGGDLQDQNVISDPAKFWANSIAALRTWPTIEFDETDDDSPLV